MRLCFTSCIRISMAVLVMQGPNMFGQKTKTTSVIKPLTGVPTQLHRQMEALGARMAASGNEQTVYIGEVETARGVKVPAQVTHQLPGLVRLQGFRPSVLSFDGETATGVVSLDDELLLETFLLDLQEGILTWARTGAAVRILGVGFGPDPRVVRDYTGPRYDIVEVTGAVPYRSVEVIRSKLYYFDSETGLLRSTRYSDFSRSAPIKRETHFSQWKKVNGSFYPGRIDHYEGGRLVFSFTTSSIASAPAADRVAF